jgi:hypothetical protein
VTLSIPTLYLPSDYLYWYLSYFGKISITLTNTLNLPAGLVKEAVQAMPAILSLPIIIVGEVFSQGKN